MQVNSVTQMKSVATVGHPEGGSSQQPRRVAVAFCVAAAFCFPSLGAVAQDAGDGPDGIDGGIEPALTTSGARLSVTRVEGRPGETVSVFVALLAEAPLKALEIALRFDYTLLSLEAVERVATAIGDPELAEVISVRRGHDSRVVPGQLNGWLQVVIEARSADSVLIVAQDTRVRLLRIDFRIRDRHVDGEQGASLVTPLRLEEFDVPAIAPDEPDVSAKNTATFRTELDDLPRDLPPEDREDGAVIILGLGEIGFFRRADANLDCSVDVGDSLYTISYLFYDEQAPPPPCEDAVDSNDDGLIDVADSLFTLHWVFLQTKAPPAPLVYGLDPTEDRLHCDESPLDPCYIE